MARYDTFTFRINKQERQMLERVAKRLERSQSDALRLLVRGAAAELGVMQGELVTAGETSNERGR